MFFNVERKRKELAILRLLGVHGGHLCIYPLVCSVMLTSGGILISFGVYAALAYAVNDSFSFRRDRYSSLWTNGSTPAASGTLLSVDLQFRLKSLCLWIVAPATPEMAPLEKNSSAYPVTVMY